MENNDSCFENLMQHVHCVMHKRGEILDDGQKCKLWVKIFLEKRQIVYVILVQKINFIIPCSKRPN